MSEVKRLGVIAILVRRVPQTNFLTKTILFLDKNSSVFENMLKVVGGVGPSSQKTVVIIPHVFLIIHKIVVSKIHDKLREYTK